MLPILLLKPLFKKYCILYMGERMPCAVLRGSMETAQSKWRLHFTFFFFNLRANLARNTTKIKLLVGVNAMSLTTSEPSKNFTLDIENLHLYPYLGFVLFPRWYFLKAHVFGGFQLYLYYV